MKCKKCKAEADRILCPVCAEHVRESTRARFNKSLYDRSKRFRRCLLAGFLSFFCLFVGLFFANKNRDVIEALILAIAISSLISCFVLSEIDDDGSEDDPFKPLSRYYEAIVLITVSVVVLLLLYWKVSSKSIFDVLDKSYGISHSRISELLRWLAE